MSRFETFTLRLKKSVAFLYTFLKTLAAFILVGNLLTIFYFVIFATARSIVIFSLAPFKECAMIFVEINQAVFSHFFWFVGVAFVIYVSWRFGSLVDEHYGSPMQRWRLWRAREELEHFEERTRAKRVRYEELLTMKLAREPPLDTRVGYADEEGLPR